MEATISAQGLKLFVRERGNGHPLLMINGIGADSGAWGSAEDSLASSSRTIVFDSPGTGRSETPMLPRSVPALARLTCALLDQLGHARVDILGFSFGGALAQQLAKDAPQRVRRVALVSTFCGWGGTAADPGAVGRFVADGRVVPNAIGSSHQLLALATWSSLGWLSSITAPTLVVGGTRDSLVPPANAIQLARRLPNSSLQLLPDADHLCLSDATGAAMHLLTDFFSSGTLGQSHAWRTGLLRHPDSPSEVR